MTKSVPKSAKESVTASPLRKELLRDKISSDREDAKVEEPTPEPTPEPLQETPKRTEQPAARKSDVELKAESLSDAAITRYWRNLESERMAKRVHQEDLSVGEKLLRYFDVSSQYGVSFHFVLARTACERHNEAN